MAKRLGAGEKGVKRIKEHSFFRLINWERLEQRKELAPWTPASSKFLASNFDDEFTSAKAELTPPGRASVDHTEFQGFTYIVRARHVELRHTQPCRTRRTRSTRASA